MRIGILTSNDVRHRHVVNALRARCEVTAVCYQDTGYVPADTAAETIDARTAAAVKHHFEERRRQEEIHFGHNADPVADSRECGVCTVDPRTLNTGDTLAFVQRHGVEAVVIYGTGMIKSPLLDAYTGRMVNLHLGLSPYYRGTATNFYPLLNDEPEYVGATIHLIDAGIDSGPIVHHARPEITADDMPHTVGCKAILAGIEKLIQAIGELADGRLEAVSQWPVENARLYLRKDYHPSQVVRLYEMIEDGLFPKYAARKHLVENAMRVIA
ncbi:MAG TPA: formyl transferase [Phycisphaerae bacterium]|nr:formyl transferase [Phycisphaerae bacterium]